MKIVKAILIRRSGNTDYCFLVTDLPNPLWPFDGPLTLKFETGNSLGEDYLAKHFPDLPLEIVDAS